MHFGLLFQILKNKPIYMGHPVLIVKNCYCVKKIKYLLLFKMAVKLCCKKKTRNNKIGNDVRCFKMLFN